MNKLRLFWSKLYGSFWFLPTLIVAFSILVAVALIELDFSEAKHWAERWPRLFGAGAAGARGMLSTIAGSTMTVLGVVFSMILVTLALASSQYTSRILRNFMRDRVTQVVLGILAGVFTFCLVVLRTIRGGDEGAFVPSLAVTLAVMLAIVGIGVLILFLHHIASSIQASSILASVADETLLAVDRLFPDELGHEMTDEDEHQARSAFSARNWQPVVARRNGYIQNVDIAALLRVAREQRAIVRMERGIGDFVMRDALLVSISMDERPGKEAEVALQRAYSIDRYRTVTQDAGFGICQLVDIALRALSPGINDTTTAVMCLDYLTAILAKLASRDVPSSHRYSEGHLRVIAIGPTFADLVADSFDPLRESAHGNLAVLLRMLDSLQTIAGVAASPNRRRVLCGQTQAIAELAGRSIASPYDRERFESRLKRLRQVLEIESDVKPPHSKVRPLVPHPQRSQSSG